MALQCVEQFVLQLAENETPSMADFYTFFFVCVGMQVLEWNGISLTGKTYEEVQGLVGHQVGEAEICIRL